MRPRLTTQPSQDFVILIYDHVETLIVPILEYRREVPLHLFANPPDFKQ